VAGYDGGPRYVLNTNLVGTINCLEYVRRHAAKVIFFSSSRVYPMEALNRACFVEEETRFAWTDEQTIPGVSSQGVAESFPMDGARSLYGMTKLASEMLLEEYAYAYGLRYVVNRCGVLAGPWQMGKIDQGIVAFWVARHFYKKPLKYIGFGGTGKQVRDFLHVDDLADLVLEQMERFEVFEGGTFNVGGGPDHSVSLCELTDLCREATGNEVEIAQEPSPRTADVRVYLSDCARLFGRTSWRPRRTARETTAGIAAWIRCHDHLLSQVIG
jgi:CDP-paratose 2-epimerase